MWRHHDEKVVLATANYIGKLECGIIRWPGELYREAFRAILSAPNDAALEFVNARSRRAAVRLEKVDRQSLLRGTAALGVGTFLLGPLMALLEDLEDAEPEPTPTRVGATDIAQIRTVTRELASWCARYGSGGLVRDTVMTSLRSSARLLGAHCPGHLRAELHSAVGDLAETAGQTALDANAHGQARQVFRFALGCAEKAKDWPLRANVLDSMATQEIRTGQPDEALTLTELALVRADDRLTATVQTMLHATRARALAKMRRVNDALTAIGAAEDHFAHATPADDPPHMAYFTTAFLAGNTGQALFDLALLGHHPERATDRFSTAVAEAAAGKVRTRTAWLTKLASLTMATGDPLQAAIFGHEALDAADTIRSRRVTEVLRELLRCAAPHQHLTEVAHLRHRINTLLTGTDSR